ncbi:MAG: hypothetical protein ACREBA_02130 [Nitrosotalea sp.]
MTYKLSQYPRKASIGYGAIAGFVAGIAMMGVAMSTTVMIGMPYDTIPKAIGTAFGSQGNALIATGLGMHLLTSTLVGIIFGIVTFSVRKLQITGLGKGIGLGLVTGMIAFVVISIPVTTNVLPPILVKFIMHMHPGMTQQMAMGALQQKKMLITSTAILRHLVYGVILGILTSVLVLRKKAKTVQ